MPAEMADPVVLIVDGDEQDVRFVCGVERRAKTEKIRARQARDFMA
jgi:hypothetical protein